MEEDDAMSIEKLLERARDWLTTQGDDIELPRPSQLTSSHGKEDGEASVMERTLRHGEDGDRLDGEARLASSRTKQVVTSPRLPAANNKSTSVKMKTSVKAALLNKAPFSWRPRSTPEENIPPGLPGCRLGIFAVIPLKAENPPTTSRFRLPRLSISVRLLPYDEIHTTRTTTGPDYAWHSPLRFTHCDPTRTGLIIQLNVYDEPLLGNRILIGRSYAALEDALDAPGTPVLLWRRVEPTNDGAITSVIPSSTNNNGRVLISLCFHPRVSKGPTVRALLHSVAHADVDPSASELDHSKSGRRKQPHIRALMDKLRRTSEVRAVEAAKLGVAQSLRRVKGNFTFELRGIHFCGDQCTSLEGHSIVSSPDFHPIVLVRFDEFEEEIRTTATTSQSISFVQEWPVYSSFSKVEVEVYRPATLRTVSATRRRMSDDCVGVKVGSLTISCFEIQEQITVSWTRDQLEPVYGPGKRPPPAGSLWYPLMMGDEEIGLANVAAQYSEDLLSLVDSEESPDLTFTPPEERSFDAAIVQRNFERLDEFFLSLKEMKSYCDETLDWKYPLRSTLTWMVINGFFFYVTAEYLPLLVMLFILTLLSKTLSAFIRGATHKKWIEHNPSASRMKIFRPIATLRFAPIHGSHLLPAVGDDDHPDSFVRVFYEPNYKKIPVRQIAVTECARRTQNPEWSKPQRESLREDFVRRNNNRLKDLLRHLSPYAQDAVLHDVVESWPRKNGVVDVNAFRLSMLQPVKVDEATGDDVLVKWRNSPGTIRFDIMQDTSLEANPLIGRVRVPIVSLITDESAGGVQEEFEFTLPLALPSRHMAQPQKLASPRVVPTITVRMQMTLRNPNDRITLRDNLASEALYEALEMEVERELSWVAKYHKAKDVAKNFQQTIGVACDTLERFKNLFLWVHPVKTLLVLVVTLLGCVCFYFIPLRYFVLYATSKAFTRKFHKAVDKDLIRFRNLLVSIPSDLDLKRIYRSRNQEYLKQKEHSEAHARIQANWSGLVLRRAFAVHSWQERYCAIRGGRLEFWHSAADAKAGLPPKHSHNISNSLDACTKAELADVPRDGYPLVVFDVSPSLLAISPRNRRRILCLKSEEDLHKFSDAVRTSGEALPVPEASDPSTDTKM